MINEQVFGLVLSKWSHYWWPQCSLCVASINDDFQAQALVKGDVVILWVREGLSASGPDWSVCHRRVKLNYLDWWPRRGKFIGTVAVWQAPCGLAGTCCCQEELSRKIYIIYIYTTDETPVSQSVTQLWSRLMNLSYQMASCCMSLRGLPVLSWALWFPDLSIFYIFLARASAMSGWQFFRNPVGHGIPVRWKSILLLITGLEHDSRSRQDWNHNYSSSITIHALVWIKELLSF